MNSSWQFYSEPPPFWEKLCQQANSTFHSQAWQQMLRYAFPAQPLYLYHPETESACALTVFKAGPFRVGYIGFPAGQMLRGVLTNQVAQSLRAINWPYRIDLLRLQISHLSSEELLPTEYNSTLETIVPLKNWSKRKLSSTIWRNVQKSIKNEVTIAHAHPDMAQVIYNMYQKTINRHNGSIRYNLKYFENLTRLANKTPQLQCLVATRHKIIIAFLITCHENSTVYYLHGGLDFQKQQYRPSDLLFFSAISRAQEQDAAHFNMMSSPINQPTLVKYKEKWGGITDELRTYDWPIHTLGAKTFSFLARGYEYVRQLIS